MKVRQRYRGDGAERFHEVRGGLNKVGVRSFKRIVREVGMTTEYFKLTPVKKIQFLTSVPIVNEFFSNLITAILVKR